MTSRYIPDSESADLLAPEEVDPASIFPHIGGGVFPKTATAGLGWAWPSPQGHELAENLVAVALLAPQTASDAGPPPLEKREAHRAAAYRLALSYGYSLAHANQISETTAAVFGRARLAVRLTIEVITSAARDFDPLMAELLDTLTGTLFSGEHALPPGPGTLRAGSAIRRHLRQCGDDPGAYHPALRHLLTQASRTLLPEQQTQHAATHHYLFQAMLARHAPHGQRWHLGRALTAVLPQPDTTTSTG